MWSYSLLGLFIWTVLGLVASKPTEISALEEVAEDYKPQNFNVSEVSIIPPPRFAQVSVNGKTYSIHFDEVNWFTALEFCSYYGQILASITSIDDSEQLFKTLTQYGKYMICCLTYICYVITSNNRLTISRSCPFIILLAGRQ